MPSHLEHIKAASRFLRGSIAEGLADPVTGAISEDDDKLLKFHGSYQQDDRDIRDERRKQKLEPAYAFMVRARLPGGVMTPAQWLAFDRIASDYASSGLRITTRQTFQWHGIVKRNLKPTIAAIDAALASTIAACGDVNRNVVCNTNPVQSQAHAEAYAWAARLSEHLKPRTRAYHEIWLDGEKLVGEAAEAENEPLYGPTYLPRKFKIGVAIPPLNDVDVFAQDLGLLAILERGELVGFNVAIGGGMGATHGDPTTYPRLASVIGFVAPERLLELSEAIIAVQRDWGNREERKHARFKYTIDTHGLAAVRAEIEQRAGFALEAERPFHFDHNGDRYGWTEGHDGRWHLTLQVESGRLVDSGEARWLSGMREIARVHTGDIRLTCNQNLIIASVAEADRAAIDAIVDAHGMGGYRRYSGIRRHAIACVALPTCGLAMAESERYLPQLLPRLEALLDRHGLLDAPILLRLSGCPNGCSRPYLGEIALVGRAIGRYDLRLGADFSGQRLNQAWRENVDEATLLDALDGLFARYAGERTPNEHFGDFLLRSGVLKNRKIAAEVVA
ncbi:assimilatory sulfite reductase (NADPH) hemoprotein subunit [Rhodanobacter sp. DHB23]|uniref:assimilatory sulfite reductase (NADPH) hemoprotein subunit n=1 Tax=Rhodanobacter sp. DHB23 TaxID=2775923 RepID=UPI00177B0EAF|nr:assimilatory sulfite reductase (NADPH) hemoprotein subunit [Rhodanobacter sp. DHB23]MBD8873924.1 assimilatory sulfite reductase (NADPH) hemoprotein subunit [Rhodanobacter sp. DHB23]